MYPRMPTILDKKDEIISLFTQGVPPSAIARRLGVQTTAISAFLARQGLRVITKVVKRKLTLEEETSLADEYARGVRSSLLAKKYGVNQSTVREVAKRHDIAVKARGAARKTFTRTETIRIVQMWEEGYPKQEIADAFESCGSVIDRVLRDAGAKQKQNRPPGKDGYIVGDGYWYIRVAADDPMAEMRNSHGMVAEHRLVVARKLGRPLRRDESVHHIDGNRLNNDESNLQLRNGNHGKGVCLQCADCGSRNVVTVPIAVSETMMRDVLHHIDGDPNNNDPANLRMVPLKERPS